MRGCQVGRIVIILVKDWGFYGVKKRLPCEESIEFGYLFCGYILTTKLPVDRIESVGNLFIFLQP